MNKLCGVLSALAIVVGLTAVLAPDVWATNKQCTYKGDCNQMNCHVCPPGPAGGWCCFTCPNGGSAQVWRCDGVPRDCDPSQTSGGCGPSLVGTCDGVQCGSWGPGGLCNQDLCS